MCCRSRNDALFFELPVRLPAFRVNAPSHLSGKCPGVSSDCKRTALAPEIFEVQGEVNYRQSGHFSLDDLHIVLSAIQPIATERPDSMQLSNFQPSTPNFAFPNASDIDTNR